MRFLIYVEIVKQDITLAIPLYGFGQSLSTESAKDK